MSIILDALKKSETERQQQGQTEFGQMPIRASRRATPMWIWIVGALLAINLLVLLGVLFRPSPPLIDSPQPSVTAPDNAPTPAAAAPTSASFAEQLTQVRPLPAREPVRPAVTPDVDVVSRDAPPPAVVEQIAQSNAGVPDIDQLRASGELSIGPQRLDIHVFSATPENRFVFINMTKLREGATTNDGVTVEEITEDGVVLSYQGRRFFQARQ
jgi:general secretion pathway protein B